MGAEGAVFEGKTLDDAVRKGLEALGLARAEVTIKVVSEGSGGFLGLGARPYRVLIMPRPGGAFAEPREERSGGGRGRRERGARGGRDRNERGRGGERRGERGGGERRGAPAEARRGERSERGDRGERGGDRGRRDDRGRREPRRDERREDRGRGEERGPREAPVRAEARPPDEERMPMGAAPEDAGVRSERGEREDGGRRRRRRGGRGRRGGEGRPMSPAREGAASEAPELEETHEVREHAPHHEPVEAHAHQSNGSGESQGPVLSPDQLVAESTRIPGELLKAMGFEATVNATADGDRVDVTAAVTGDEDLLTGPKGEVRQALQHLLNRMLNRGEGSRYHLQLEINEFWKRRETELEGIARDLADEAINNQTEAVTEYLNAQERRIVHMTLKPDTRVKTYALGSGLIKRVAVAPADFPEGPEGE
jgi:predicted RNA-binding protein Jag